MPGPRIRSLKHTFFSDERVCEMPLTARYTFAGLIANADDEGRLKGDPRLIKACVWPLDDDMDTVRVSYCLDTLAAGPKPLIRLYTVDGRRYIEVVNFKRHQYIQKPKPSELPAPDAYNTNTVRVPDEYRRDGMGWERMGWEWSGYGCKNSARYREHGNDDRRTGASRGRATAAHRAPGRV